MSETLTNGVIVPDKGSRDWYADLRSNWLKLDSLMTGGNITVNPAQTEGILVATITVGGKEYKLYQQDGDVSVKIDPSAENAECPLIASTSAEANTGPVVMAPAVTVNPSTGAVTATSFKGKLDGNASTATKATQDANGAVISTTYATKTELNSKANDNSVVHKSGAETIDGLKTFNFWQIINMGLGVKWITGHKEQKSLFLFASMDDSYRGHGAELQLHTETLNGGFNLIAKDKTGTNVKFLAGDSNGSLMWNNANILTDNNQIMVLKNLTGALIAPGAVIDCGTGNGLLAGWYMEPSGSWALASNKITGKWKNASIYTVGGEHSTIFVKVG